MYYIDTFQLHRTTKKEDRVIHRIKLNRNDEMQRKLKHQHYQCFWCGCPIDMSAHLDHLIPLFYGGDNRRRNLVASCKNCNLTKGTDQIEITNKYTIKWYKRLIKAHVKHKEKLVRRGRIRSRYMDRDVQSYHIHRADLFKYIKEPLGRVDDEMIDLIRRSKKADSGLKQIRHARRLNDEIILAEILSHI